jgi:hypothetical protein
MLRGLRNDINMTEVPFFTEKRSRELWFYLTASYSHWQFRYIQDGVQDGGHII